MKDLTITLMYFHETKGQVSQINANPNANALQTQENQITQSIEA
jgi:hypothetical protein